MKGGKKGKEKRARMIIQMGRVLALHAGPTPGTTSCGPPKQKNKENERKRRGEKWCHFSWGSKATDFLHRLLLNRTANSWWQNADDTSLDTLSGYLVLSYLNGRKGQRAHASSLLVFTKNSQKSHINVYAVSLISWHTGFLHPQANHGKWSNPS